MFLFLSSYLYFLSLLWTFFHSLHFLFYLCFYLLSPMLISPSHSDRMMFVIAIEISFRTASVSISATFLCSVFQEASLSFQKHVRLICGSILKENVSNTLNLLKFLSLLFPAFLARRLYPRKSLLCAPIVCRWLRFNIFAGWYSSR